MSARLVRPKSVTGARLRFRNAERDDARFILSLRLDPQKNAFLSPTTDDERLQQEWLRRCDQSEDQVYFIIETMLGEAVGTVRIYDPVDDSFCWGSWILADGAPPSSAVESTVMVYRFGLACGFVAAHFDVRRGNEKVWRYHERLGAVRTAEDELDIHYAMDRQAIDALLDRYRERVPDGVSIEW